MMKDIYEEVGEPATLELVAEEASELAQACLKLSRILRGENPTPVPEVLAAEKVMEEAADVQTALSVLSSAQWYDEDKVMHIQWKKSERWKERLRKRERLGNGQRTGNNLVNKSGGLAEDLVDDCISRAAAIEALGEKPEGDDEWSCGCCMQWERDTEILKTMQPAQQWTPCTPETMPDNEHDVLVTVEIRPVGRKPFRRVVRAFYTDGKHTDADSAYTWYELEEPDFDDDGNIIVPEGWWESSDYSEEVSPIDDFVISWREQPKPQKGEGNG